MKIHSVFRLMSISGLLMELRHSAVDRRIGKKDARDGSILGQANRLEAALKEYDFNVSLEACNKLNEFRRQLATLDADELLGEAHGETLSRIVEALLPTILAESKQRLILVPVGLGGEYISANQDVSHKFRPSVFEKLPEIARYDFTCSMQALAFDLPTASAFHALRGTEATLRFFYCSVERQKTKQLSEKDQTWGAIEQKLRVHPKNVDRILIDSLSMIRQHYRNPTAHPETVYDLHSAHGLLNSCIEIVGRLVLDKNWKILR